MTVIPDPAECSLVTGPPSIFCTWGFDVIQRAVALCDAPKSVYNLTVNTLGFPDLNDLKNSIVFSQSPNRQIASLIDQGAPTIMLIDTPTACASFLRQVFGADLTAVIRELSRAACINRSLFLAENALIINYSPDMNTGQFVSNVVKHLGIQLSDIAFGQLLNGLGCSEPETDTIHDRLNPILAANPASISQLGTGEQKILEAVISPTVQFLHEKTPRPIRWPLEVLLSGDRPNLPAQQVTELNGRARILIYGPYYFLPRGLYAVTALVGFAGDFYDEPFSIEIHGTQLIGRAWFRVKHEGVFRASFKIQHIDIEQRLEIRLINQEGILNGKMGFGWVEFQLLDDL